MNSPAPSPIPFLAFLVSLPLMLSLASAGWSASPLIISGHPEYPPYMWNQDNTLQGIGQKIVKVACKELNLQCQQQAIGSWKRVQELTRSGEVDIITGAYSNEERRTYMDYSIAYMQDPTNIFVSKEHPFVFNGKEDLIGKRGISMFGESYGQEMDTFISNNLNLSRTYTTEAAFKNLKSGQVDYMLWGYYPWQIAGKKLNTSQWCQIQNPPLITEGMHITFSKKSGLQALIPQFNKIIKRLQEDGSLERWRDQFILRYKAEQRP